MISIPISKSLLPKTHLYEALLYLEASINSVGQDGTKKTGLPINNMKRACKIVMQQDTSEAEEDEEAEECGAGETVLRVSESTGASLGWLLGCYSTCTF